MATAASSNTKATGPPVIKCSICKRDITSVHIRCAECPSPHVELCIECFALGSTSADVHTHTHTHAYHMMDNLASFSLYDKDWTAKDELMLLDGIDMYGFGNWREIATYIGTKSEAQCQKHYMAVYLESPSAPLPAGDPCVCAHTHTHTHTARLGGGGGGGGATALGPAGAAHAQAGARAEDGVDGGEDGADGGRGAAGVAAAAGRSGGPPTGNGTPGYSHAHIPKVEVSGYMPLRGDFDIEHDNDAENILADMEFVEGEHATETELKLKILEIYNAKLDERERRKAFVLERGLLEYKRLLAVERRRPKEEREVYDQFRPFARFLSPSEFEQLVRGIILENRLRKRIAQLQEYRKLGIRSLAEAAEYEAAKRRKDFSGTTTSWAALRRSAAAASEPGLTSPPAASGSQAAGRATRVRSGAASASGADAQAQGESEQAELAGRKRRRGEKLDALVEEASGASKSAHTDLPFSLEGIPGVERLSPQERTLCEHLRLLPNQYQQIKATIVNISFVRGFVKRNEPAGMLVHVGQ